jgi:hypothetical protein
MIVKIEISSAIEDRAKSSGFQNVEQYVQNLIENDLSTQNTYSPNELPFDEWKARFDQMLKNARPGNPTIDDSRESIYAERFARILGQTNPD